MAGTLRSVSHGNSMLWNRALYEDGSGGRMILLEHAFRHQSDFNRLLGVQEIFEEDEDEGDSRETYGKNKGEIKE